MAPSRSHCHPRHVKRGDRVAERNGGVERSETAGDGAIAVVYQYDIK
jgi:hypothetical protein